jgi:hypothetical protein
MTHRAARVVVLVAATLAVMAGGYLLATIEKRSLADRRAAETFEARAVEASLLVERLRGAQQAYVAEGQGHEFWMGKAGDAAAALGRALTQLAAASTTATARTAVESATRTLGEFERMDRRAREYVQNGQRLMASDLIFTESRGATTALALNVDRARHEERAASDDRQAQLRDEQLYIVAAATAICLVAAFLLFPAGRPAAPHDTREALRALIEPRPPAGIATRTDGRAAAPAAAPPPAGAVTTQPSSPPPANVQPFPRPMPPVDLAGTARICAELARVLDPAELPALLERAAGLLRASGIIVWVADRAGTSLFPMLAHGYPAGVLARMGSIARDADNAAAAAYREAVPRTVPARGAAPGALVTPIVTAEGCVGVLAAEMRDGAESDEATRAVAGILAAQLATFVTALPPAEKPEAQQPSH